MFRRDFARRFNACRLIALGGLVGCFHHPPGSRSPEHADVVEVGYGVQPRATVSAAIASLNRDQIRRQHALAVADLLEGVPGVQVIRSGASFSVRVRSATGDPLVVVDGTALTVTGTDALAALNPTDIERIDVLKDGAATAIYGWRGGSGVILIRTKRAP